MSAKSKNISVKEFKEIIKNATPEARFGRHQAWMSENKHRLEPNVFWVLKDLRKLLKDPDGVCDKKLLILALLKTLDNFKQFFDHYPYAVAGARFKLGRKSETIGPIRKRIRTLLKKTPSMTNEELWALALSKPPSGWTVIAERSGKKYLEGPHLKNGKIRYVHYPRFRNIAAEERG